MWLRVKRTKLKVDDTQGEFRRLTTVAEWVQIKVILGSKVENDLGHKSANQVGIGSCPYL